MNPLVRLIRSHIVAGMALKQYMDDNYYPIEILNIIMAIARELLHWSLNCRGGYVFFTIQDDIFVWGSNGRNDYYDRVGIPCRESNAKCYKISLEQIEQIRQDRVRRLHLIDNNIVLSCGSDHGWILGYETCKTMVSLRQISVPNVRHICLGHHTGFIITHPGEVYATGDNKYGQLGIGCQDYQKLFVKINFPESELRIVKIACGRKRTLFLTTTGNVYACGKNTRGQLGQHHSIFTLNQLIPAKIKLSSDLILDHVIDICCGDHYSMAITRDGHLYTWGSNEFGQLGLGDNYNRHNPQLVSFPEF